MSYEIAYKRQFIRIDNKIIPLVLYGSNNCYEPTWKGRERREREWHPMYFGRNTMIAQTEESIMKKIQSLCGGTYQDHFMRNGKWVDDAGLIRFFKNGIKDAKTIEELYEIYFFYGLNGYFSIWGSGMKNTIENRVSISSSDDLRNFLIAAQERLNNRAEKEEIYICLKYNSEEFHLRNPKIREKKPKEKLTDFYAIKVNNSGYLFQLTRRRIRYTYYSDGAKQFKTEKDANKYIQKIQERFRCTLEVEHIVA